MAQTGKTAAERASFLGRMDAETVSYLIHRWETDPVREEEFWGGIGRCNCLIRT